MLMKLATFMVGSNIYPGIIKGNMIVRLQSFISMRGIDFSHNQCLLPLVQSSDERVLRLLKEECDSISKKSLAEMASSGDAFPLDGVKIIAPIVRPPAVFCLGFNYRSHAPELKRPIPEVPIVFMKPSKSVIGQGEEIILPKVAARVDYEVELTVVIGKGGRYISKEEAFSRIFGYTILNDITARDIQQKDFSLARPWLRSKGFDTFAPIGPYIVTTDEIPNPMGLDLSLKVNGEVKQSSNTKEMIFDVPSVVEYISSFTTLEPGSLIAMGTPEKIGQLHDGDTVDCYIEGIGVLSNKAKLER